MAKPPVFEPRSGMSFDTCVEEARRMAKDLEKKTGGAEKEVTLHFSAVALPVKPDSDARLLWQQYNDEAKRLAELQRPAEEARLQAARDKMSAAMGRMDNAMSNGQAAAFAWIQDYAACTGFIGVDNHKEKVLGALKDAGYISNEFGLEGSVTEAMISLGSRARAERYMIGQLMFQLEDDAPLERISEMLAHALVKTYPPGAADPGPTRLMRPLTFKNSS